MLRPLDAAAIWTAACGPDLRSSPEFVAFNTRPATGTAQVGRLAFHGEKPIGFVLASAVVGDPAIQLGWIDAVAVVPSHQRQGVGSELLRWAEAWLTEQQCDRVLLGGSLRPFVPGLPAELGTEGFFRKRGFHEQTGGARVWDVARRLRDYTTPEFVHAIVGNVQAVQPGQEELLRAFLEREFPGRWHFECQEFLREGGRASDYLMLWTDRGVDGFCQLTFEDSLRPVERFHPHRLPHPWGQLGPIGVSPNRRGQGYGAALLDAGLRRLHERGVDGCVIDWTTLLEFYGKFGFAPYREYAMLNKELT